MPSVNKTANYGLNQWQGNEYPKRQDFVEDNKKIDDALKELEMTMQSDLSTEILNRHSDFAILNSRMNTFIAVSETTDNAETVDMRLDKFGYAWGSAGDAVRNCNMIKLPKSTLIKGHVWDTEGNYIVAGDGDKRACTTIDSGINVKPGDVVIPTNALFNYSIRVFDGDGTLVQVSSVWETSAQTILYDGYLFLNFRLVSNEAIPDLNVSNMETMCVVCRPLTEKISEIERRIKNDESQSGTVLKQTQPAFSTYLSDITFINDTTMLMFPVAPDDHSSFVTGKKVFILDNVIVGSIDITHNIGHANTIDYNEKNKCLLCSSGSGYIENDNVIYIFPNASLLTTFDVNSNDCITINDQNPWANEIQLNAVWGEDNIGQNNIIYCISNEVIGYKSATQNLRHIRQILLGTGTNQLEYGTYTASADGVFNGTFKVLNHWTREWFFEEHNNGAQFYNGKLYEATIKDSGGICYLEHSFEEFGSTIVTKKRKIPYYGSDGTEWAHELEGIALRNNKMYVGTNGESLYCFKL